MRRPEYRTNLRDRDTLANSCATLRAALVTYPQATPGRIREPYFALASLEDAALNAPQNSGWLRLRRLELRKALHAFTGETRGSTHALRLDELYNEIVRLIADIPLV